MFALPIRGYHPLRPCFPDRFWLSHIHDWPSPRSLATTSGVSVDVLSSRYLDVSVPWVRFKPLWIQGLIPSMTTYPESRLSPELGIRGRRWVSPFGNPRIKARSQLPRAYWSVPRPSSPL